MSKLKRVVCPYGRPLNYLGICYVCHYGGKLSEHTIKWYINPYHPENILLDKIMYTLHGQGD